MNTTVVDWDLNKILSNPDENDLLLDLDKTKKRSLKFQKYWNKNTSYLTSAKSLKKALDEYNELMEKFGTSGNAGYYIHLKFALHQNDSKVKALVNKVTEISNEISTILQFFEIRLSKIDTTTQQKLLASPLLNSYKHFLEKLFETGKYVLSEPEERILTLKSPVSHSNWTKMVSGFLSKEERLVVDESGKKVLKNFSEIIGLINSTKKKTRDSAAQALNQIFEKHVDTAEHELNAILQNKKINDSLRGYNRPDTARHISDDISTEVVDTLTKAVSNKFGIAKRFYKLKARLMNKDKLAYHERNVPIGQIDQTYTFKDGSELVYEVFNSLDCEFGYLFEKFVTEGRLDVYPKKGKSSGAFCTYGLLKHPSYSLLNWNDKLQDVLTLAHEMGHGINFELVKKKENALNFGTPTSTAEVASTFMEDFVLERLLENADDTLRLSLIMMKLNDDISTIFRQIAFYNFETELHKDFRDKGYLSKEEIGTLFKKHMVSYMGPAVSQDTGSENWWIYISHFRYFFYVYSYSSGLLISKSLQNEIKINPQFITNIKQFLSTGLSKSPKDLFDELGIDISNPLFWNKGLREVDTLLKAAEKLARKLKKI